MERCYGGQGFSWKVAKDGTPLAWCRDEEHASRLLDALEGDGTIMEVKTHGGRRAEAPSAGLFSEYD